jgi:hypothetical protein
MSADDLLLAVDNPTPSRPTKKERAKEIISEALSDGPLPVNSVNDLLSNAGISPSTAERARDELGVVSHKSDFGGVWKMSLPDLAID